MEELLNEKISEFKEKETQAIEAIKRDYDIKVKAFREKYKELEQKEFNYLENEFNEHKDKMHQDHNKHLAEYEKKLRASTNRLEREEEDLRKRSEVIEERRRAFDTEWTRLNQEEKALDEKKTLIYNQMAAADEKCLPSGDSDHQKLKYEAERLRLENQSLETKLTNMQVLLDKLCMGNEGSKLSHIEQTNQDSIQETLMNESEPVKLASIENDLADLVNDDDDADIKELIKQAKLKLKLRYYGNKPVGQLNSSNDELDSSSNEHLHATEHEILNESLEDNIFYDYEDSTLKSSRKDFSANYFKKNRSQEDNLNSFLTSDNRNFLSNNINKERDLILLANELLNKFSHSLMKRKSLLDAARLEDKYSFNKLKPSERLLMLDKEEMELEEMALNIKAGRRLVKQKKSQFNLLEFSILDKSNSVEDFQKMIKPVSMTTKNLRHMSLSDLTDDSNLNELLFKLSNFIESGQVSSGNARKLQPILRTLPKLNAQLKAVFKSLSRLDAKQLGEMTEAVQADGALNFINQKWHTYLSATPLPPPPLKLNATETLKSSWENLSAYHRLTLDSGTKLLEEKWSQYMGESGHGKKFRPIATANTTIAATNGSVKNYVLNFKGNSNNGLPVGTQQRLNHHRDWLKKFKADSDFKNNSSSSIFF